MTPSGFCALFVSAIEPFNVRSSLRPIGGALSGTRPILAGMAKKPEPQKPTNWTIYKIAAKQTWVGTVEAADEAKAIEKAAAEFRVPATKLHAVRR
jgi:membrane-bound lytic murein transglycosylase B